MHENTLSRHLWHLFLFNDGRRPRISHVILVRVPVVVLQQMQVYHERQSCAANYGHHHAPFFAHEGHHHTVCTLHCLD